MSDTGNAHQRFGVVNDIDHAPVTHSDAPLASVSFEIFATCRSGAFSEGHNLAVNPGKQHIIE
jgi:hypothetical protein